MKNKEKLKEILDYLREVEEGSFVCDEAGLETAYQKNTGSQSLSIKALSILGGILASFAFNGFLSFTGLYDSGIGMVVVGVILIATGLIINQKYNDLTKDAISVSTFIIGLAQIAAGLFLLGMEIHSICLIFIAIAFISICIVQNYILSFIAVLIITGSILGFITTGLDHNPIYVNVYVSLLALITSYCFVREAKIIIARKALSKLYSPFRSGLTLSFLSILEVMNWRGISSTTEYRWIPSIIIISIIISIVSVLLQILNITSVKHKVVIYAAATLTLLPTLQAPSISGAILVILLSFYVNYKTGFVIGIASFIYFISEYYYDLNLTLLTKSILLFSSGILFLLIFLFTRGKMTTNEKI